MKEIKKEIVILSGSVLYREDIGDFRIDLESLNLHKDRLILDWNHDENQVIGYVENIHTDGNALLGTATLQSVIAGDRAEEVIERINGGCPFELSPTVILDEALSEQVTDGDKQYTLFKSVPLRGVSICLFGTDEYTKTLSLKDRKVKMRKQKKLAIDEEKKDLELAEEILDESATADEVVEETPAEKTYTAHPDLEEFIAAFGFENGVEYFRQGLTIDEAKAADYEELKKLRCKLAEEEAETLESVDEVVDAIDEGPGAPDVEVNGLDVPSDTPADTSEKKLHKVIKKMANKMHALNSELCRLRASGIKGADPVSSGVSKSFKSGDPLRRYAEKIAARNRK